ncbi:hypothetical protein C0J52_17146 [Blattella germanica]|nr:hypothetical protein C0J52_17146 [Blattella germanica]
MADTSKYTIKERIIISVWVHEKERSGETYEEIRENFFLRFNKAAPSEANLRKLEKKTFSTGSILDTKRSGRPKKYCGDDVCNRLTESLERSPMKSSRKRSAEMQIPRTSLLCWMKNGYSKLSKLPQAMRAVQIQKFGGPETLKIQNIPIPSVGEQDILIRVHSAGINPVDTYIREGAYATLPSLPAILGKEKGDRVFAWLPGNGGYAEYVATHKENVFPLSEKLTFSQGAGLYVPYFTAYRALITKCNIKAGEVLLVHGASGAVGIAAVQIAKAFGLVVAGTAGTIEGMELVKKIGADHVFNHKDKGYLNNAVAAIGGQGFNVVLENLANVNLGADLTVLNQHGKVAVVGSRGTVEVNPRSLMLTEGSVIGVMMAGATKDETREAAQAILKGIDAGWVSPVVAREYTLDEAALAHDEIIHSSGARGKLVFKL